VKKTKISIELKEVGKNSHDILSELLIAKEPLENQQEILKIFQQEYTKNNEDFFQNWKKQEKIVLEKADNVDSFFDEIVLISGIYLGQFKKSALEVKKVFSIYQNGFQENDEFKQLDNALFNVTSIILLIKKDYSSFDNFIKYAQKIDKNKDFILKYHPIKTTLYDKKWDILEKILPNIATSRLFSKDEKNQTIIDILLENKQFEMLKIIFNDKERIKDIKKFNYSDKDLLQQLFNNKIISEEKYTDLENKFQKTIERKHSDVPSYLGNFNN
jgi:hypothetical protein